MNTQSDNLTKHLLYKYTVHIPKANCMTQQLSITDECKQMQPTIIILIAHKHSKQITT